MSDQIQAYPLTWPITVPRTASHIRERGNFGKVQGTGDGLTYMGKKPIEFGAALNRLKGELKRAGAKDIVVSTNVPTRGDGMPYASARQPEDPGVAVYFKREGQPMCFPCDRFKRLADNVTAIAKHIDAMRGMERWGVGTSAQLYSGYKALPPKGGTSEAGPAWWTVLGVGLNATRDQIEAAFKQLARKYHPDVPVTGDAGAMATINRAREAALMTYT